MKWTVSLILQLTKATKPSYSEDIMIASDVFRFLEHLSEHRENEHDQLFLKSLQVLHLIALGFWGLHLQILHWKFLGSFAMASIIVSWRFGIIKASNHGYYKSSSFIENSDFGYDSAFQYFDVSTPLGTKQLSRVGYCFWNNSRALSAHAIILSYRLYTNLSTNPQNLPLRLYCWYYVPLSICALLNDNILKATQYWLETNGHE